MKDEPSRSITESFDIHRSGADDGGNPPYLSITDESPAFHKIVTAGRAIVRSECEQPNGRQQWS